MIQLNHVVVLHPDPEIFHPSPDVEQCILTGKILERQKDVATAEWKYRINGKSLSGNELEVVAKLSPTGKVVIITVYMP